MENTFQSTGRKSAGFKVIFRSLRHRNYRLFFLGQSISVTGSIIQFVALSWLVYRITGSVVMLGLIGFAGRLPILLLSPLTGVLIDRWNRRKVMIVTQILLMLQAFGLAIFFFAGIEVWQIFMFSIIMGCINAFDIPARHSFVIDLVERKDNLGNAIALNSLMFNGAMLIGPSIAGILLANKGEGVCFMINAVSYLFVIVSLFLMNIRDVQSIKHQSRIFSEMKAGFKYTFGFPPIKYIILLLALLNLLAVPHTILLPAFAKDILQGNAHTYGFLLGSAGFGALIAAFYLAYGKTPLTMVKIIPWSAGIFGIGLILFAFSRLAMISFILMAITGFGDMLHTAASNTMLQTITDDDKRGRVTSMYTISIVGIAPFGSLLIGESAKILGITNTIVIGGVACLAGALIFFRRLPDLKLYLKQVL